MLTDWVKKQSRSGDSWVLRLSAGRLSNLPREAVPHASWAPKSTQCPWVIECKVQTWEGPKEDTPAWLLSGLVSTMRHSHAGTPILGPQKWVPTHVSDFLMETHSFIARLAGPSLQGRKFLQVSEILFFSKYKNKGRGVLLFQCICSQNTQWLERAAVAALGRASRPPFGFVCSILEGPGNSWRSTFCFHSFAPAPVPKAIGRAWLDLKS